MRSSRARKKLLNFADIAPNRDFRHLCNARTSDASFNADSRVMALLVLAMRTPKTAKRNFESLAPVRT